MLALFNISPVKDERGNPVIPSDDSTNGGITYVPLPAGVLSCPHVDDNVNSVGSPFRSAARLSRVRNARAGYWRASSTSSTLVSCG